MNMLQLKRLLEKLLHTMVLLSVLWWSSEGMTIAASYPAIGGSESESFASRNPDSTSSFAYETPSLEQYSTVSRSVLGISSVAFPASDLPSASHPGNSESSDPPVDLDYIEINPTLQLNVSMVETDGISYLSSETISNGNTAFDHQPTEILPSTLQASGDYSSSSSLAGESRIRDLQTIDAVSHFHTPLMSLLVAPPSSDWVSPTASVVTQQTVSADNEISSLFPVPADPHSKKLLMLILRAEDCTKFSKSDFERMLAKLMTKFGFDDAVPELSTAKCYSHLNINLTVGGPTPTLRFLPGKDNFTVDVLNRTFRIIKFEKVDLRLERTRPRERWPSMWSLTFVGAFTCAILASCAGGTVIVCVLVCCVKCVGYLSGEKSGKKATYKLRWGNTLTLPRAGPLHAKFSPASETIALFSTISTGSVVGAIPTVDKGVVQPCDTSIVPLEDSSNLPASRDPSVKFVPTPSDLKTFNIQGLSGKDSKGKQRLTKSYSKLDETKLSGLNNPSFQRY